MKKFLCLFTSFLFFANFMFAFQNNSDKKDTPKNVVESILKFRNFESSTSFSNRIEIPEMVASPFLMLSGYLESENFDGNFFYKIKTKEDWSAWIPFPKIEHGKTPNRTTFFAGEIPTETELLKIKCDQPIPANFHLRIFAPGHSDQKNHAHTRSPESACTCDQPNICGRNCWCPSGDCPIDSTPFPTVPTHIIVHHSAGQTTSTDFAAVVRSYYDLHVNTNGWDDIGYNWLVDGNGVIYEGRGSGLQGAHFSCMNENTTGICVIGNFVTATPSTEAIDALQNFIAWEACDKDIDISAADFHMSAELNLDNISGHRDGNDSPNACSTTVCPGENLYDILPAIRDEIAAFPCLGDNVGNENVLLENEKIEISPNPNQGFFEIKWENVNVKNIVFFDATGKEIKNVNKLLGQQNQGFSLQTMGLYFVKIELSDNRFFTKKIIVQP